jgi:hypothetical protein
MEFDNIDAASFNNLFVSRLDTAEGIEKAAAAGGAFVRDRLRELAFSRAILPPEYVTKVDCQRSVNHDTLVKIVDIEPQSSAVAINFRGTPDDRYVEGDRYELPFYKIASDKFHKSEAELLAYDYPVTKKIEENSVKDLQTIEDTKFIAAADALVTATGKSVSTAGPIDRAALVSAFKLIDEDELAVGCVLMHKSDHDDWLTQPATEIGDSLASEVTVNGYKYNKILGHKLVVTIKGSIVPPGTVWIFCEPKYLGNFFILNDTKFFIKKEADMITWMTWEYIAAGFGNRRAVAKLTLT